MKRAVATLVAVVLLAGCRGSSPSFDPFAAYGPHRVPPPATGSYGRPDTYYQPPATSQPPAATPFASPPAARPLPATPPPSLGTEPPGTTNLIPPPVAPTKWQPSDSDESVNVVSDTISSAASSRPAGDQSALNVRKNDRLIWSRPDKALEQQIRPASAAEPILPSSDAATERLIGHEAPQVGAGVTAENPRLPHSGASAATPSPQPFTPQGPLTEITQLPAPKYLPNNFRPLAVRRSRSSVVNATVPSTAVFGVPSAGEDDCVCLPPDDAIGAGVAAASSTAQSSSAQSADLNSVLRDNNRGPATARIPAAEEWKRR